MTETNADGPVGGGSVAGKYRKKPVVIEAMRFDGTRPSIDAICRWANDEARVREEDPWITYVFTGPDDVDDVLVDTLEGHMRVSPGDYVIKGVQGEFYPCKPDIFDATYEAVEPEPPYVRPSDTDPSYLDRAWEGTA